MHIRTKKGKYRKMILPCNYLISIVLRNQKDLQRDFNYRVLLQMDRRNHLHHRNHLHRGKQLRELVK